MYDWADDAYKSWELAIATLRHLKTAAERELPEEAAEQESKGTQNERL